MNICQHYGTKPSKKQQNHHPEPVARNMEVKVLLDFEIRTDKVVLTRRADIVAIDNSLCTTVIIDVV